MMAVIGLSLSCFHNSLNNGDDDMDDESYSDTSSYDSDSDNTLTDITLASTTSSTNNSNVDNDAERVFQIHQLVEEFEETPDFNNTFGGPPRLNDIPIDIISLDIQDNRDDMLTAIELASGRDDFTLSIEVASYIKWKFVECVKWLVDIVRSQRDSHYGGQRGD